MKRLLLGVVTSAQDTTDYAKAYTGCIQTMDKSTKLFAAEPLGYRITPATKKAILAACDNKMCKNAINNLSEASENYVSYESVKLTRKLCELQNSKSCSDLCRLKTLIFEGEPTSL